jgi:hypothetical protein
MDTIIRDLNNELEKKIKEYFLSKEFIKVHNNPIYIDASHNYELNTSIDIIEIPPYDLLNETSFWKDVKGEIEFMAKIDSNGSSQTHLHFKFTNTSFRYDRLNRKFQIELGIEFFSLYP